MKILHVTAAHHVEGTEAVIAFDDGFEATFDLLPLLNGPVFEPLHDIDAFSALFVDPLCGTLSWPGGVDLAPEAIRNLTPISQSNVG